MPDPALDRAAPLSVDGLRCENFRLRLVRYVENTNDLTPVVAALTEVGSSGVERAESIPVGPLAEVLQSKAPVTRSASPCAAAPCEAAERPQASNIVDSLFAELRRVFD